MNLDKSNVHTVTPAQTQPPSESEVPCIAGLHSTKQLCAEMQDALAVAASAGHMLALVCINVGEISYSYGEDAQVPDEAARELLLHACAERISARLMAGDVLAHLGGPNFAVLLSRIEHPSDAVTFAHGVIGAFQRPLVSGTAPVSVHAGAGVAVYPTDGDSPTQLLEAAKEAAQRAGEGSSGQLVFSSVELHADERRRQLIREGIGPALENNEFVLHYQPVLGLGSGEVVAVEALIRWQHPQRGLIPPMDFIPVAEQSGQIVALGKWVLTQACRQARNWQAEGLRVRMAVNLSARQFAAPDLVDFVARTLKETGLDPSMLELELTESVLAQDEASVVILERLRSLGVHVAIDDFGTGFSSLSYLTRFPLDTIKLDRTFISRATRDQDAASVLSSMIAMVHGLGLRTVAEGVETSEQQRLLIAHGCDLVQGFLHSPPLPAEACQQWLSQHVARALRPIPGGAAPGPPAHTIDAGLHHAG